ncbi:MAG: hypothetical protein WCG10_01445 [Chlamydiota bacterium]
MKKLLLSNFLIVLLCLYGCQSSQDYTRKGCMLVQDLRKDFEEIHSYEDLMQKEVKLKKKMRRLTTLMIKASDVCLKDQVEGVGLNQALENDRLRYEMHRVCVEVEGAKNWLEDVQADMLDKLDIYERKTGKK